MIIIFMNHPLPEAGSMMTASDHMRRFSADGAMPNCFRKAAAKWLALV
jgi:hypothetical protein